MGHHTQFVGSVPGYGAPPAVTCAPTWHFYTYLAQLGHCFDPSPPPMAHTESVDRRLALQKFKEERESRRLSLAGPGPGRPGEGAGASWRESLPGRPPSSGGGVGGSVGGGVGGSVGPGVPPMVPRLKLGVLAKMSGAAEQHGEGLQQQQGQGQQGQGEGGGVSARAGGLSAGGAGGPSVGGVGGGPLRPPLPRPASQSAGGAPPGVNRVWVWGGLHVQLQSPRLLIM